MAESGTGYSAGSGVDSRRRSVDRARMNAPTAHRKIVVTIGSEVPSKKMLTITIMIPPETICRVPPSADAMPAIGPCSSKASTIVVGMTNPRQAKAKNSMAISTARLSTPASDMMNNATAIAAKPETAVVTTRAMPKRVPRLALNWDAPIKPTAFMEKAKL